MDLTSDRQTGSVIGRTQNDPAASHSITGRSDALTVAPSAYVNAFRAVHPHARAKPSDRQNVRLLTTRHKICGYPWVSALPGPDGWSDGLTVWKAIEYGGFNGCAAGISGDPGNHVDQPAARAPSDVPLASRLNRSVRSLGQGDGHSSKAAFHSFSVRNLGAETTFAPCTHNVFQWLRRTSRTDRLTVTTNATAENAPVGSPFVGRRCGCSARNFAASVGVPRFLHRRAARPHAGVLYPCWGVFSRSKRYSRSARARASIGRTSTWTELAATVADCATSSRQFAHKRFYCLRSRCRRRVQSVLHGFTCDIQIIPVFPVRSISGIRTGVPGFSPAVGCAPPCRCALPLFGNLSV